MVSKDKPNFCSCSRTSGILAELGYCEVDVVSLVSLVVGGGAWLHTHLLGLGKPSLSRPVGHDKNSRCLILSHSLKKCIDYTEWGNQRI